jgi:photosystem II stability/assembly factor-like uncharacterized protein
VLKTTDGGQTWTVLGASVGLQAVGTIVVHPTDPNTVYTLAAGGVLGIWKTTDGGSHWANTAGFLTGAYLTNLVMDPSNPQTLYTVVSNPAGASNNGVYKTTNGGQSWSQLTGLPTGTTIGLSYLSLCPAAPQTLYLAIAGSGQSGSGSQFDLFEMLRTTDGGASWTVLPNTPNYMRGYPGGAYHAVDPSSANTVYVCGKGGFYKSTDGGQSWSSDMEVGADGKSVHHDTRTMVFDPLGRLLSGNDGGITRLDNANVGSVKWTSLNGNLNVTLFLTVALHPTSPDIAYASLRDLANIEFTDSFTWNAVGGGIEGIFRIDPVNPSTVYATSFVFDANNLFARSDDGGQTWATKTKGLSFTDPGFGTYVLDPSNSSRLLLSTNRIYLSTNRGDSWSPITAPGTNGWTSSAIINILAVAPSDPQTIYATTTDGHLFVSTDNGASWQRRDIPNYSGPYSALQVDPTDARTAYVTLGGAASPWIWKTSDGGATWSFNGGNLPNRAITLLQVDFRDPGPGDDLCYVALSTGVYVSSDQGLTWSQLGTGLPNATLTDLELNRVTGILAAATYGRGLWELAVPTQAASFTVTGPSGATAGTASNFTVTARDIYGKVVPSYTGTIHFTSSDGHAQLPADYTFVAADGGTHDFSATFTTAGSQSLTATDTTRSSITGSATVAVGPAAAAHFTVGAPVSATAGTAFNFTLTALDPYGNTATGYTGVVHFSSSDSSAILPGDSLLTKGTGIFSATLERVGSQSITATDTVTSSLTGTSGAILVGPGSASQFTLGTPGGATTGTAFPFTVTAFDAYGNTATGYSGTVHFTSSDPGASLPGNSTLSNGTGSFSATLNTSGSRTLTATDTANGSLTGTSAAITVRGLVVSSFTPTPTGFSVSFSKPFVNSSASPLNLYDAASAGYGAADVTLVGAPSSSTPVTPALLSSRPEARSAEAAPGCSRRAPIP